MAHELIIEQWSSHVLSRALATVAHGIVRANSIITVDNSLAGLVQSAEKVEGVVWHEPAAVEGVAEELGETLGVWLSLVKSLVNLHLGDHVLVKSLNISDHATGSDHALLSKLSSSRVILAQDGVALRHSGVSSNDHEVFSGDTYRNLVKRMNKHLPKVVPILLV